MTTKELIKKANNQGINKLTNDEYNSYYNILCEQYGLDPVTRPLEKLNFRGKIKLYATRAAAEQLIKKNKICVEIKNTEVISGCYIVITKISMDNIYFDSIGSANIENLKGEDKSNAILKAHTKSVRRGVLSICGLGMLDESETDFIKVIETAPTPAAKQERRVEPKHDKPDFEKIVNEMCPNDGAELILKKIKLLEFYHGNEKSYTYTLDKIPSLKLDKVNGIIKSNGIKI